MVDTPEQWFHRRATHYVEAQVLFHLNQAGVFGTLAAEGPCTVEELAQSLRLEASVLATALDYIRSVDRLLERTPDGRYSLTDFGRAVLSRYGRDDGDRMHINLFDVRVGAYGPVWAGLGQLLTGQARYGEGVARAGEAAAAAVYTVSARMIDAVHGRLRELGAQSIIEIGVSTGLLTLLGQREPGLDLRGLDRSQASVEAAQLRAVELGVERIEWCQGDFFAPESWAEWAAQGPGPRVLMSVHFHELLAAGPERLRRALMALGRSLPGLRLLVLEQPRLPDTDRDEVGEVEWLYSQSNILIHHLIGNGRILAQDAWNELFVSAGGVIESCQPMGFLGYNMSVIRLEGGNEA